MTRLPLALFSLLPLSAADTGWPVNGGPYNINAPFGGIVHLSSAPGAPALAPAGSFVEVNATVCLIEAMKVFVEVRAERAGIVEAVLVQSGDEVDAGKPLLRIG